jgi:amino acid transporter
LAVITTGSIALLAFVFGDYCSRLYSLGEHSPALYAALIVIVLTAVNIAGVKFGAGTQNWLTIVEVLGLLVVTAAGLIIAPAAVAATVPGNTDPGEPAFGLCMVFVLLTYGGWNEAAYISAELKDVRRNMLRALVWSMVILTALYLLVNLAYLRGLGLAGMARSQVVAADLLQQVWGDAGARIISVMIAVSALTSINATIIVGARSSYALGCDWPVLGFLGRWNARTGSPTQALLVQGAVALALVAFGASMRQLRDHGGLHRTGVLAVFLLTGLSLFVLRWREPGMRGRSGCRCIAPAARLLRQQRLAAVLEPGLYASGRSSGRRGARCRRAAAHAGAAPQVELNDGSDDLASLTLSLGRQAGRLSRVTMRLVSSAKRMAST